MARSQSSIHKPWNLRLDLKWELMRRDPLGEELSDCLFRLHVDRPSGSQIDLLKARIDGVREQLRSKYDVGYVDTPSPSVVPHDRALAKDMFRQIGWVPSGSPNPMSVHANWGLPGVITIRSGGEQFEVITSETMPRPRAGEMPVLAIHLRLADVTLRDLDRLGQQFKLEVRRAIKALPDDLRWSSPLAFLRTVSSRQFRLDLSRYDLFVQKGRNYRQIARIEAKERVGRKVRSRPRPGGTRVAGESSVEESVSRIYFAIHRARLRARRRQIDMPAMGIEPHACSIAGHGHGRDCPATCPTWVAYKQRLTLPSARSGTGSDQLTRSGHVGEAPKSSRKSPAPRA